MTKQIITGDVNDSHKERQLRKRRRRRSGVLGVLIALAIFRLFGGHGSSPVVLSMTNADVRKASESLDNMWRSPGAITVKMPRAYQTPLQRNDYSPSIPVK